MEKKYAEFFKVKYAISVNSWSTGLICALGALDLNPGDEVILLTGQCPHVLVPFYIGIVFPFLQI